MNTRLPIMTVMMGIIKTMMLITKPEIRYFKPIMPIGKTKVTVIKTKVTPSSCVTAPSGVGVEAEAVTQLKKTVPRLGRKNLKPDRVTAVYRQHHARNIFG